MEYTYRVLVPEECAELYRILRAEGVLWAFDCLCAEPSEERGEAIFGAGNMLVLGGFLGGKIAGVLTAEPFCALSQCAEIGLCARRFAFGQALPLARGALRWVAENLDCKSLVGKIAAPNRHASRLAPLLGFAKLGTIPGLCWYARKRCFVDGGIWLKTL